MSDPKLVDLIDQLGKASMDCRAAMHEAHAATKDLRQAVKEAKEMLAKVLPSMIDKELGDQIRPQLETMAVEIGKAQRVAEKHVGEELDKLINLSLGRPGTDDDLRPALQSMIVGQQIADRIHEAYDG